jgi:Secretion system C-terminal sorting domain
MKKLYSLFAGICIVTAAYSQCIINTSLTVPGIYPDTITNLPLAYAASNYATDIQTRVAVDTITSLGTFPFQDVVIDSVVGLPVWVSYLPNPSSGVFPGGSNGCIYIQGTPPVGAENGGPLSDGVYPITVYTTATVLIFNAPVEYPFVKTGYKIHVLPANSVPTVESFKFGVAQAGANPADLNSEFRITAANTGTCQFTMYNILGEMVRQENVPTLKGTNNYKVETGTLTDGVYLCTFRMGNAVITRRITVSH